MAQILGTSQAWQQVVQTLKSRNLDVKNANELKKLLSKKESDYKKRIDEETIRFENELKQLLRELEAQNNNFKTELAECQQYSSLEIEFHELAILLLQDETWIFQKIKNRTKIRSHKMEIRRLKIKQDKCKEKLLANLVKLRSSLEYRQTHRDSIITTNCSSIMQDIVLLKRMVSSHELAGADAELEIIEHLRKLPGDCYVISGITLARDKARRFDGQWLKTAQIDHLVITPAGPFVIEAKNWSKEFTREGNYFDPYQQVKRASYLCYEVLRSPLFDFTVRSIIVHRGDIPEKPKDSYTKVLHINEVNGYILRFKDKILSDTEIKNMVSYLRIWSKDEF